MLSLVVLHGALYRHLILGSHHLLMVGSFHQIVEFAARLLSRRDIAPVQILLGLRGFRLLMAAEHFNKTFVFILIQTLLQGERSRQVLVRLQALVLWLSSLLDLIVAVVLPEVVHILVWLRNVGKVSFAADSFFDHVLDL